jgi:subtilisin family serine protease
MRTYNVILKKGVDYQSFWDDMENENDGGNLYIPNRRVDSPNLRPNSQRQTWYTLSDEEAETVRNDERVLAVEIPPEQRDDIIIAHSGIQTGVFDKTTSDSGNYQNWGLIRTLSKQNNYGSSNTSPTTDYTYTLTGKGVDVIIQDSGIERFHPEWAERFESVNWGSYSGGSFTQSGNHDRDYDGHGSHCAGIAAGKTFGFARGAKVLHQKISGLEGSGDSGTGISPTYAFDAIKSWHNSKTVDPNTGYVRPTVINMSWGYLTTYTDASIDEINYRSTSYTGTSIDSTSERENNFGLMYSLYSVSGPTYATNTRIASVDTDIEELLDAGVHICCAAGNRSHKIDESGGDDYDNYFGEGGDTPQYYHRGSSPYGDAGQDGTGPRAIIVGNMDSTSASATNDQKATSSETGPGVDIYAPGTNVMSATSNTNKWGSGSQNYYLNSSFKQTNISGTSMASPQVAGVLACILELYPGLTPAEGKQWLLDNAGSAILNTGTGNDWTNDRSLKGGEAKVLHLPFTSSEPAKIRGFDNLTFNIKIKEQ